MAGKGRPRKYPVGSPRKTITELHGFKTDQPDETEQKRRHDIKVMVSTDTPLRAIAELSGLTLMQLKNQYKAELGRGWEYVYGLVSQRLVEAALHGDRQSQLLWLRHRGGWQDVTRRELSGPGGGPISVRNLDTAALAQVVNALTAPRSAGGGKGRDSPPIIDGEADLDAFAGSSDDGAE